MAINPLQAPINYMAMAPQINLGQQFSEFGQALAQRQKRQEVQEAKQQYSTDLQQVLQNPSMKAFNEFSLKHPQQREVIKDVASRFTQEQQDSEFNIGRDVAVSLENNNPDAALNIVNKAIEARKSSNLPTTVYDQIQQILSNTDDPDRIKKAQAQTNFSLTLLNPEKFSKVVDSLEKQKLAPSKIDQAIAEATTARATAKNAEEKAKADADLAIANAEKARVEANFAERLAQSGLTKANWDIKNLQSTISDRAAKLNLDKQTTAATVAEKLSSIQGNLNNIPADTRKLINESATLAATAKQSADQFNDLAKRIESAGGNYGVMSTAEDFLKKTAGFQGGMTQLKQEYTRLRNTAGIKSLPPGPATDKDIAMALSGFPTETARAPDLARFLRGMAKMQDIDSSVSNAKTDWLASNNGTLTRAKNAFVAGDYSVKPGETFNDFSKRVVGDVTKRYDTTRQTSAVDQIPTPMNPTPNAAAGNIQSAADAILSGDR